MFKLLTQQSSGASTCPCLSDLLEQGVQQGHVGLLGLDGVGEEGVGLVGLQQVDGDGLHPQDEGRLRDVLLDHRPHTRVRLQEDSTSTEQWWLGYMKTVPVQDNGGWDT